MEKGDKNYPDQTAQLPVPPSHLQDEMAYLAKHLLVPQG